MNIINVIIYFYFKSFMIDLFFLRHNRDFVTKNLHKRGFNFNYDFFFNLDNDIKFLKTEMYLLNRERNLISFFFKEFEKNYFFLKILSIKIIFLKKKIFDKNVLLKTFSDELHKFLSNIPNILHKSVHFGKDSFSNLEIRTYLNSKNLNFFFNSDLFNDFESNKKFLDFDLSAKISGAGFVILKNELAELHRAIGNYMVDRHVNLSGYKEICSPVIVNDKSMFFSGHFPKFKDEQFSIKDSNFWLIPTAEVVLTNLVSNSSIKFVDLPLKFVSKTLCFRKEKGSYGYLVKGMIRQHQFEKVELVHIVEPNMSYDSLDELVFNAESILQELDLPYRVLSLCSMDIGFTASKTYDLEVWMPKRKVYLEVSSCSNTESFQSIRMCAKLDLKNNFVYPHILNGSGLAIGRVLLSIIENYSDSFGNIFIPNVLVRYMNGKKVISF